MSLDYDESTMSIAFKPFEFMNPNSVMILISYSKRDDYYVSYKHDSEKRFYLAGDLFESLGEAVEYANTLF